MNPLTSQEIKGTWATLLLPINRDQSIDYARLSDEIDVLLLSEVDGIYSNGTAGEFYAQTEQEFDKISSLLAEKCEEAGMPFQIGASHTSAQLSLSRLQRASQLKPGAIQVILPDWFPLTLEESLRFLQSMAEAAFPIGLVLYNPPHAKVLLKPSDYGEVLARVPTLVGIKTAGGDEGWYAQMRTYGARLSIFVPGNKLASASRQGAVGSYSNVACLQPAGAKRWNQLMTTCLDEALEFEYRLDQFLVEYILPFRDQGRYSNQALDKLLAAVGGWSEVGTRLRWPYCWIEESVVERLRPVARAMLPELFGRERVGG